MTIESSKQGKRNGFSWMLVAAMLLMATSLGAQTVTKTFRNERLKTVLREVERQTKMSVIYRTDEMNENKIITATFKKTPLRAVLDKVLDEGFTYEIEGSMVTIHRKRRQKAPETTTQENKNRKVSGTVVDVNGEPLIGVSVMVKGTGSGTITNIDGEYSLSTSDPDASLVFSYVGYTAQTISSAGKSQIDVTMAEESSQLREVVVTAMGIQRKEESLTYATQRVKSEDLMKVQDPNVANTLEGKVAGLTITPSAGGAGGASKIVLRGAKSILGNSSPLIVVDGVPMSNNIQGQHSSWQGQGFTFQGMSEGSDPLSLINPDDIESINVLKGANAAALYGSVAANGVMMITTKRGREGRLDISLASNVTFDTPLITPDIQNVYGASILGDGVVVDGWGSKIGTLADDQLVIHSPLNTTNFHNDSYHDIHLRNYAENDVDKFFRTGVTTNNSLSLSGGTEKLRTYFSMSNSHATGMMRNNNYNRNTVNLRQSYKFFERVNVEISLNYAKTVTRNRPGGGTVLNPIYHMYLTPRNIDMEYYRTNYMTEKGQWMSNVRDYYQKTDGAFHWTSDRVGLEGPRQNWAFMQADQNNPYWLMNMNNGKITEDRLWGIITGNVDIYDGLTFQARFNYDYSRRHLNSQRYATTFIPSNMDPYGFLWDNDNKNTEIYIDYLLSYNKQFGDISVSATAGWVGHTVKSEYKGTAAEATSIRSNLTELPTKVNYFELGAGGMGTTSGSKGSNWDRAWLFTAQVGWKDMVFVDGSYRRDWYRPFRYFKLSGLADKDNFGYFGVGANAIVSKMVKMPEAISYMKYRLSYSEVGNSIPNVSYDSMTENLQTGAINGSNYTQFRNPRPEKTSSFETGIETLWFDNRLSFDVTYYNASMSHLYMTASTGTGLTKSLNSAKVRNQGIEATVGYDFKPFSWLRWRTTYNVSYNDNKILDTVYDMEGNERMTEQLVGGTHVIYKKGGKIGDMYIQDFARDANGHITLNSKGQPQMDNSGNLMYIGNMNSNWQMGWSNTFTWKELSLSFLINGRLGGKVISLTEQQLDFYGFSQRTADARLNAEANNIVAADYDNVPGIQLSDGSGRIVPIKEYYQAIGSAKSPIDYIYDATNFRLRELSLGYTFRNLMGQNKNLTLSFIGRNLFFIYKKAPTDPDVSLSTVNGLGAFELYNMPSSRSYGFSLKLNL